VKMTEEQKKRLTEWLGECWHDENGGISDDMFSFKCSKCGKYRHFVDIDLEDSRSFTTSIDMMDVKDKLVKNGDDIEFEAFVNLKFHQDLTFKKVDRNTSFINWLINPIRFCKLAEEFIKYYNSPSVRKKEILALLDKIKYKEEE